MPTMISATHAIRTHSLTVNLWCLLPPLPLVPTNTKVLPIPSSNCFA